MLLVGLCCSCWAAYEDARCKCVCVNRTISVNATKPIRKIYVKAIAAEKCTCPLMLEEEATALCPYCDCTYQVRNTTTIKVVVCLILVIISALTLYMLFLLLLEPLLAMRRPSHRFPSVSMDNSSGPFGLGSSQRSVSAAKIAKSSWNGPVDGISVIWNRPCVHSRSSDDIRGTIQSRTKHRVVTKPNLLISSSRDANMNRGPQSAGVSNVVRTVRNQQQRWKGDVETQRARVFSEHTLLN